VEQSPAVTQALRMYDLIKGAAAVAMCLRVLFFFRVRRSFGMFFSILQGMFATIYVYIALVVIFVIGFGLSMFVLFNTDLHSTQPSNDSFTTLGNSFTSLFETILGSYDFAWFDFYKHEENYELYYALIVVLAIFIVVMLTIVRPAFTAIVIETYAKLQGRARLAFLSSFSALVMDKAGKSVQAPGLYLICVACTTLVVLIEGIFTGFSKIRDVIRIRAIKKKAVESVNAPDFAGNAATDFSELEERTAILQRQGEQPIGKYVPGPADEGGQVTMPGAYWYCAYCHSRNGYYTKKTMAGRINQWGAKMQIDATELAFVSPSRLYCFECMRIKNSINYFELRFRQIAFNVFMVLFWPPCCVVAVPCYAILMLVDWLILGAEFRERERVKKAMLHLYSKRTESCVPTTALIDSLLGQRLKPTLANVHTKIDSLTAKIEVMQTATREARMKQLEDDAALEELRSSLMSSPVASK
jgi:hypothetical protein